MRERERKSEIPRERNQAHQWQMVVKRKPKPHQAHALHTCFVNFLPLSMTSSEIGKIFKTHGFIEFIYIPMIKENSNHKCAFVKFKFPQSLPTAIRDENGKKLGDHQITVYPAKFDKSLPPKSLDPTYHLPPPPSTRPPPRKQLPPKRDAKRDSRTYKEVTSPQPGQTHPQHHPIHHTPPYNKPPSPKTTTLTFPHPSSHRIMHSRALGDDTEKIRSTLGAIDLEGDYVAAIKGKKCDENEEMMHRSVVAVAASPQSSELLMDMILTEGVNNLSIKTMGGMLHLITFVSNEDKKAMVESKWLDQWFVSIQDVNDQTSALWRETWLNIYGVPLSAWSYENFYNIGCIFGRVISVNYNNLDRAQVLIISDCMFEINGKISLEIDDMEFPVFVSEYKSQWNVSLATKKSVNKADQSKPTTNPIPEHSLSRTDENKSELKSPITPHAEEQPPLSNDCMGKPQPDKNTNHCDSLEPPFNEPLMSHTSHHINPLPYENQISPSKDTSLPSPQSSPPSQNGPCNGPRKPLLIMKTHEPKHNFPITSTQDLPKPTSSLPKGNSSLPLSNKFGPLQRQPKTSSTSSGSLGSSSGSGPLFPPGFEDTIPSQIKIAQLRRRKKKLEKKRKLMMSAVIDQANEVTNQTRFSMGSVSVEDIVEMAGLLGLSFSGPRSELRSRIQAILNGQFQEWSNNHK